MNSFSSSLFHLKNERGSSLVLVLLVIVMFTILGVSLMGLGLNNVKMSASERNDQATYYIAEAGIVEAMSEIEAKVEQIKAKTEGEFFAEVEKIFADIKPPTFEKSLGSQPEAVVSIKKGTDKGDYSLVSEGIIDSKKRILEKGIKVEWKGVIGGGETGGPPNFPENLVALIKRNINLSGSGTINGDVATPSSKEDNLIKQTPEAKINGKITYDAKDYSFELPPFPEFPMYPTPANKEIINSSGNRYTVINNGRLLIDNYVSNKYLLEMSDNLSFKEIKLASNYTLTIDTGDSDKQIVVDQLNNYQGHINIVGNGKLTVYIKESISLGGSSTINKGKSFNQLNIYLQGARNPQTITFSGDQKIFGSVYAENANINFSGSGGFQGHILTGGKKVKIDGGSSGNPAYIFAPNADFTFTGSGLVKGTIVGNSLYADGGTSISYEKINTSNLPFFPSRSGGGEGAGGLVIDLGGINEK
ncbi:DUF7305 domain-containing protein [Pseudogracilibacillus auburnensis]|uniref:DUF7305 domain-containing protein n=1 Tax=Pseudogracilibacillus auburnensis TaxID=1494959 RepID=UPI001A95CDD6|nr:PilX N-terminal domain-containing pilus assembly protein [Pseudogracilibacillus auburnensis]MBO1004017.1 DUF2807 domain-containing protein [Pseudogracilibacillus auburnensis]